MSPEIRLLSAGGMIDLPIGRHAEALAFKRRILQVVDAAGSGIALLDGILAAVGVEGDAVIAGDRRKDEVRVGAV